MKGLSLLHRHALLASADGRGRAGSRGLEAGPHRSAAPLSAVLQHDDAARPFALVSPSRDASRRPGPYRRICCWPDRERGFVQGGRDADPGGASGPNSGPCACCFRRMAYPRKIVDRGDPYQWQVERTVAAVVEAAACPASPSAMPDHVICYQSRVGPLAWIKPPTDAEIRRAGAEGLGVVVVPDRLRVRAFRNAGRARHRISASGRGGGGAVLSPPADGRRRSPVHRRAGDARPAGACPRKRGLTSEEGVRICSADKALCPWRVPAAGAA